MIPVSGSTWFFVDISYINNILPSGTGEARAGIIAGILRWLLSAGEVLLLHISREVVQFVGMLVLMIISWKAEK